MTWALHIRRLLLPDPLSVFYHSGCKGGKQQEGTHDQPSTRPAKNGVGCGSHASSRHLASPPTLYRRVPPFFLKLVLQVASQDACCAACLSDESCHFWVYDTAADQPNCW